MGRKTGIISKPKGRPKGSGVKTGSRSLKKCCVNGCRVVKRGDKLRQHQRECVLWDFSGKPADISHPSYMGLSDQRKSHTDFFRDGGFDHVKFPYNQTVGQQGPLDNFVVATSSNPNKKLRLDSNENIESDSADEHVSDIEEEVQTQDDGEDATLNMHISPSPYSPAVGVGLDKGEYVGDGLNNRGSDANEDTDSYSDRDSISDSDKSEDGGVGANLNTHQPPPAFHDSPTRSVSPSGEDDWVCKRFANPVEMKNIGNISRIIAKRVKCQKNKQGSRM